MTTPVICQNIGDEIYMRWVDNGANGFWIVCLKSDPRACTFVLTKKPDIK